MQGLDGMRANTGKWSRVATGIVTFLMVVAPLHAICQERDPGKEVVKDLLRSLIESQLERDGLRNPNRPQPQPPGVPATAEMQQLKVISASLAQETTNLSALLNADGRRSPEIRQVLPDVLRVQTTAVALKQRTELERDHRNMAENFRGFSRDWAAISFRLQACSGLSPQSRQTTDRIGQLNTQFSQLLGIQDQFDNRELVRTADMLVADLRVLVDEVSYSGAASGNRGRLVSSLRRHQERSVQFANLAAAGTSFRIVVSEYQTLYEDWQKIRPETEQITSRTVSRTVARIQETHRGLHRSLRLNIGVDPTLSIRLADQLQRELTDLNRSITLEQIMTVAEPRSVAISADALSGNAANLHDVLSRREDLQTTAEAWFYLDEAWRIFSYHVESISAPETRRRLEGVSQSMDSLRSSLGITVAFDAREISAKAASIQVLAERIQTDVLRWLSRPGQQDVTLRRLVDQFEDRCAELAATNTNRRNQPVMLAKCDEMIVLWQQIRPLLQKCSTDERESLERSADTLTPELVRMRMMVEE
ncbi:MAG: hypothetical protein JNL58_20145 [Planctomyces sp.]|nr:hypothetical protein [Planctomyces sp.]